MIKNIWTIYKEDLKRVFTNYAAIIVILALCILPSLYAWFNIKASWDPYGQEATSQIKIGVINNDKGTELNGKAINIGDQVIDQLKENDLMGWQFVDEAEGERALEEGTFYATITIPDNFSKDITSLVTSDVKKGQMIYRVNEKINAIAPKLTSKGATGVQENINQTIVETVSGILFEAGKGLGLEIQETVLPQLSHVYDQLEELISKFGDMNSLVQTAHNGGIQLKDLIASIQTDLPLIETTITSAKTTITSLESFMDTSKSALSDFMPTLKNDLLLIQTIADELNTYVSQIEEAILSGSDKAPELIENLITKVESTQSLVRSFVKVLESFNKFPAGRFDDLISQLQGVNGELDKAKDFLQQLHDTTVNGGEPNLTVLNNIKTLLSSVSSTASSIYNRFDSAIVPSLNNVIDQAYSTATNVLQVLKEAETKLPDVASLLNTAYEGADKGIDAIEYINSKLPEAENKVREVTAKLGDINESQSLQEVLTLLQEAVTERQNFMSSPVDLVEETIFPMHNYGTAMTPFYSVLAQWVGMTLLISMLSVHAKGEYRPSEEYFGKFLLFATIALVQGLIIALGDLYLLNIYCVNPGLFIVGILFTSITFTFIVYSLVSVFGNVGKVVSIILLVLQVAGSGGTFPIQLTPKFFQIINPFLPFTYAISFARESIGGIVENVLAKDIIIMCIYSVGAVLISLFLKKPINKLLQGFAEKFEESGLGE
ncbi:YhgE/Pip domain-containing protein [Turicibacter bilis]|uniref:YhgE/Pip domain-containing protein n=1 Tax=Turicibacter bilis TaxID=2735723 RepID=UPI001BAED3D5|nr:YhgE/Pip domain-containing protein [Turicibacter bilis]MDY4815659.1 YhgE/Pip domain-containing protein [Turicibacter bilis]UUF10220.1 YhgE/Pip domain-containing protein [Turicibacter bilis]